MRTLRAAATPSGGPQLVDSRVMSQRARAVVSPQPALSLPRPGERSAAFHWHQVYKLPVNAIRI
ncbi:MAG: hypothetical protein WCJ30_10130, partial [Deltaproteobacteria bacterium]